MLSENSIPPNWLIFVWLVSPPLPLPKLGSEVKGGIETGGGGGTALFLFGRRLSLFNVDDFFTSLGSAELTDALRWRRFEADFDFDNVGTSGGGLSSETDALPRLFSDFGTVGEDGSGM
jgi:hypothetical protein